MSDSWQPAPCLQTPRTELNRVDPRFFYRKAHGIWKRLDLVGRVPSQWGLHSALLECIHTPRVVVF